MDMATRTTEQLALIGSLDAAFAGASRAPCRWVCTSPGSGRLSLRDPAPGKPASGFRSHSKALISVEKLQRRARACSVSFAACAHWSAQPGRRAGERPAEAAEPGRGSERPARLNADRRPELRSEAAHTRCELPPGQTPGGRPWTRTGAGGREASPPHGPLRRGAPWKGTHCWPPGLAGRTREPTEDPSRQQRCRRLCRRGLSQSRRAPGRLGTERAAGPAGVGLRAGVKGARGARQPTGRRRGRPGGHSMPPAHRSACPSPPPTRSCLHATPTRGRSPRSSRRTDQGRTGGAGGTCPGAWP